MHRSGWNEARYRARIRGVGGIHPTRQVNVKLVRSNSSPAGGVTVKLNVELLNAVATVVDVPPGAGEAFRPVITGVTWSVRKFCRA